MDKIIGFLSKYFKGPMNSLYRYLINLVLKRAIEYFANKYRIHKREQERKKAIERYHEAVRDGLPDEERRKRYEDVLNSSGK